MSAFQKKIAKFLFWEGVKTVQQHSVAMETPVQFTDEGEWILDKKNSGKLLLTSLM